MEQNFQKGTSLLLSLLILTAVLVIAFGVASIMVGELKISRETYESLRSYAAAQAGMEKILYEKRQGGGGYSIGTSPYTDCSPEISGVECLASDNCYSVDFDEDSKGVTIKSYGCYKGTRRAIEVYWEL